MRAIGAPCKDCTARHVGCHQSCIKYIAFDRENRKIRRQRLESNNQKQDVKSACGRMKKRRSTGCRVH